MRCSVIVIGIGIGIGIVPQPENTKTAMIQFPLQKYIKWGIENGIKPFAFSQKQQ